MSIQLLLKPLITTLSKISICNRLKCHTLTKSNLKTHYQEVNLFKGNLNNNLLCKTTQAQRKEAKVVERKRKELMRKEASFSISLILEVNNQRKVQKIQMKKSRDR